MSVQLITQFLIFLSVVQHSLSACSVSTCTDLGWGTFDDNGDYVDAWSTSDATVCGESDWGLGGCSDEITYDNAELFCTSVGARLCTLSELQADEAKATGCNYDYELVWSSDSCGTDQYYVEYGSTLQGSASSCESKSTSSGIYARCCADAYHCTSEPTPLPSPKPTPLPTPNPTITPSFEPTSLPTLYPTHVPTPAPTKVPLSVPTIAPSALDERSYEPSAVPTHPPSFIPTEIPSETPSASPTTIPSSLPTSSPTRQDLVKCEFTHKYLCPNGCSKFSIVCDEVSAYEVDAEVDVFNFDDSAF
mmetsp:Transcript_21581/g.25520  ORF Transcript_21581/g.25520 Transcript_21581/m.25520 type:complete len:305 (+) Transcript_21581:72-986(+)